MDKLSGYVEHIVYRNASNGYTVLNLVSEEEEVVVVGIFQSIDEGENIVAEGIYTEHKIYGSQFKMEKYKIVPPGDLQSIKRYLGSGAIKGVGPAIAERIIKKFGEDALRIMEEEPERLAEIKGISEKRAREIGEQAEEKKDMKDAMIFLQRYGISNTLAVKIFETYHMELYSVIQENPYRMAEDINGVGFKIADEIARKVGIHTDSDYRIGSALLYIQGLALGEGHTYLPEEMLLAKTAELLEIDKEQLRPGLENQIMDRKLILKEDNGQRIVFGASAYYTELNCARMLYDLNVSFLKNIPENEEEADRIRQKIRQIEKADGIGLDELQRDAVLECVRNGVFILTGGPGTGKTTAINTIIHYFEREGMDIFLAAPTGRAAKRMTEATGYEARTIHRLLEMNGAVSEEEQGTFFERNENNPLESDIIIIDEMSMVDIYLFYNLLKAVSVGTRLILVGDMYQLPSVGPGKVLKDLIESKMFPVVMLEKIFRQEGGSDIVLNAHRIHKGQSISLNNQSRDFFFLSRNDINVIYKHMIQLITEKLPGYIGAQPYDIQVLTPMRKGGLGVETLNKILQEHLNPKDKNKSEYLHGEILFRQGDKVMQIKNDYKLEWEIVSKYNVTIDRGLGIFNGDMGVIKEINTFGEYIMVEYDEHKRVRYSFSQLDELELSYAITIHKSQGSEYPAVILPILTGPRMLFNRNLLYTGVTRARSCVTLLGSGEMINQMIQNENEQKRYAGLRDRIREMGRLG